MAECVPEQAPWTEAAYQDLVSRYPYVVAKPGDNHLYGFTDLQDAEDFLMLESAWTHGAFHPTRILHLWRTL